MDMHLAAQTAVAAYNAGFACGVVAGAGFLFAGAVLVRWWRER